MGIVMSLLEEFLVTGVFAFLLTFARIGAAMTIMPGIGDSFTPANIRLYIALGLSLVLAPFIAPYLPSPLPPVGLLFVLIGMEFVIGIFFGTMARIFMAALDTAGTKRHQLSLPRRSSAALRSRWGRKSRFRRSSVA